METVKTSRFTTEVAPAKFISATREPFKNMLTTISEEDFDFDELVRATAERNERLLDKIICEGFW